MWPGGKCRKRAWERAWKRFKSQCIVREYGDRTPRSFPGDGPALSRVDGPSAERRANSECSGIDYGSDAPGVVVEEPEPYLVIPGHDGPRWLIPARSSAAASVLRAWHPYNLTSRMDLEPELLPRLAIAYLLDQLESHCRQRGSQLTAYTLRQLEAVAG
jgi:hypothetical protein